MPLSFPPFPHFLSSRAHANCVCACLRAWKGACACGCSLRPPLYSYSSTRTYTWVAVAFSRRSSCGSAKCGSTRCSTPSRRLHSTSPQSALAARGPSRVGCPGVFVGGGMNVFVCVSLCVFSGLTPLPFAYMHPPMSVQHTARGYGRSEKFYTHRCRYNARRSLRYTHHTPTLNNYPCNATTARARGCGGRRQGRNAAPSIHWPVMTTSTSQARPLLRPGVCVCVCVRVGVYACSCGVCISQTRTHNERGARLRKAA